MRTLVLLALRVLDRIRANKDMAFYKGFTDEAE